MKNYITVAVLAAAMYSVPAAGQDTEEGGEAEPITISGGVAGVSQYRFRGIDLSDAKPAVQGWIDVEHSSGAYAGAWASSIDGFGEIGGSNVELDLYAGYRTPLGNALSLDVGAIYYVYPGAEGGPFNYIEPYAKLSAPVGPVELAVGAAWAPAQDSIGGEDNLYLSADASLPVADTPFAVNAHLGRTEGDSSLSFGGYTDWSLGASVSWRALSFGVSYIGTDIDDVDAFASGATPDIVDDAVVVSLGAEF